MMQLMGDSEIGWVFHGVMKLQGGSTVMVKGSYSTMQPSSRLIGSSS